MTSPAAEAKSLKRPEPEQERFSETSLSRASDGPASIISETGPTPLDKLGAAHHLRTPQSAAASQPRVRPLPLQTCTMRWLRTTPGGRGQ